MPHRTAASKTAADEKVARLADDIRNAILLRENFFLREMDLSLQADGWTLLYALDTAILHHYFHTKGFDLAGKKASSGNFRVFGGPTAEAASEYEEYKIGDVIIRHIVRSLSSKHLGEPLPLLLLPGHSEEAGRIYETFVPNFAQQHEKRGSTKASLERILDGLDHLTGDARFRAARSKEDELHKLLYSIEQPHEKFAEYTDLMLGRKLVSLKNAAQHPLLLSAVPKALSVLRGFQARDGEVEMAARWWSSALNRIKFPPKYADQDKAALSTLDALNERLKSRRVRIILLTTNNAIIDLGREYKPEKYAEQDGHQYTFSDLYIRHPRCLFSEPEIIRPQSDREADFDVTTWLDAFLTEVTGAEARDLTTFRELARSYAQADSAGEGTTLAGKARAALGNNKSLHKTFFLRWQEHLKNVSFAHVSTTSEARRSIIAKLGDSSRADVMKAFKEHIDKLTEESWYRFFKTAAQLGYGMIGLSQQATRMPKRNPPPVYLGDMEKGDKVLKLIFEDGVIKKQTEILDILSALDRSKDARDQYVSTLLYALLFTFAGRWSVAKLIAQRAIYLTRTGFAPALTSHGSISGREARYFAAVASRMTAKRIGDLEVSEMYINEASESFDEEAKAASASDKPKPKGPPPTRLRFDAEAISIRTSGLLFRASDAQWKISGDNNFIAEIRKTMIDIESLIASAQAESIRYVRVASLVNLRGNYFSCAFMLECGEALGSADRAMVRKHVIEQARTLPDVYRDEHNRAQPSLPDIYLITYAASLDSHQDRTVRRIEEMYFDNSESDLKSFCVMPYDRRRYIKLDQFIEAHSHTL